MNTYDALDQHFIDKHDVTIEKERLTFSSQEDFEKWWQLDDRNADYIIAVTAINNIRFYCNRSNYHGHKSKSPADALRMPKKGGSIKIDGICPARIIAKYHCDGHIDVLYVKTHVGHEMGELRAPSLTLEEEKEFADKMKAGISLDRILEDAKVIQNGKLERKNVTIRDDLKYIRKKFNIEISRDPSDVVATAKKVKEWNSDDKNYAFIFKEIGATHAKLKTSDFALGFMNATMEKKLKDYSDIICMDGTHGTNRKKYDLTVMMVKDNENKGFPVAFFLSNRQDQLVQEVFLEALKDRIGEIVPKYFMADGDGKYYEAWKKTMGNSPRRLLCTWHVKQTWNRQSKKIKNTAIREDIMQDLQKIMVATNVECFRTLKDAFFQKLQDEDETVFLDYLQRMYFKDEETIRRWAYCHRLYAGINTNMALESFNGFVD